MDRSLRLGLLLDSFYLPAWTCLMLEKIRQGEDGQTALAVIHPLPETPPKKTPALYRLFNKIEDRLPPLATNAMALQDASPLLEGVPVVTIPMGLTSDDDDLAPADLKTLQSFDLDILLETRSHRPTGNILNSARMGVWYFNYDGVMEVLMGAPVTGCALYQAMPGVNPDRLLYASFSATDPLSTNLNRSRFLWKGASFVPRILKQFRRTGENSNRSPSPIPAVNPNATGSLICAEIPGNAALARLLVGYLLRYAGNRLNKLIFYAQWHLLFNFLDASTFIGQAKAIQPGQSVSPLAKFKKLMPPRNAFWSDPFVLNRDGLSYLFFEEFIYKKKKGHISMLTVGREGIVTPPQVVLEQPYHLSYPFLFEWQGALYMLPETDAHHAIEVYRCLEFPNHWVFERTLMSQVHAVDTTLFPYQGRWWMFTNLKENKGASNWDELFLFSADQPLSDRWEPHPGNPIVSDVRRARPAGAIFEMNGGLYRPSQDCSHGYGYGLNLNRILTLSTTEYCEQVVGRIIPGWDRRIRGVHTYNQSGKDEQSICILDGKSRRFRFP